MFAYIFDLKGFDLFCDWVGQQKKMK